MCTGRRAYRLPCRPGASGEGCRSWGSWYAQTCTCQVQGLFCAPDGQCGLVLRLASRARADGGAQAPRAGSAEDAAVRAMRERRRSKRARSATARRAGAAKGRGRRTNTAPVTRDAREAGRRADTSGRAREAAAGRLPALPGDKQTILLVPAGEITARWAGSASVPWLSARENPAAAQDGAPAVTRNVSDLWPNHSWQLTCATGSRSAQRWSWHGTRPLCASPLRSNSMEFEAGRPASCGSVSGPGHGARAAARGAPRPTRTAHTTGSDPEGAERRRAAPAPDPLLCSSDPLQCSLATLAGHACLCDRHARGESAAGARSACGSTSIGRTRQSVSEAPFQGTGAIGEELGWRHGEFPDNWSRFACRSTAAKHDQRPPLRANRPWKFPWTPARRPQASLHEAGLAQWSRVRLRHVARGAASERLPPRRMGNSGRGGVTVRNVDRWTRCILQSAALASARKTCCHSTPGNDGSAGAALQGPTRPASQVCATHNRSQRAGRVQPSAHMAMATHIEVGFGARWTLNAGAGCLREASGQREAPWGTGLRARGRRKGWGGEMRALARSAQ